MFKWIKKCIDESIAHNTELTVDVAKSNYQKYLDDLVKKQEEYKLELCDDIKRYSRSGFTFTTTRHIFSIDKFITKDYLNDLKVYFDAKGFDTKIVEYDDGDAYLRISWG